MIFLFLLFTILLIYYLVYINKNVFVCLIAVCIYYTFQVFQVQDYDNIFLGSAFICFSWEVSNFIKFFFLFYIMVYCILSAVN